MSSINDIYRSSKYNKYKSEILKDPRSSKLKFEITGKKYYVYRITHIEEQVHYYGSRNSQNEDCITDLLKYCSSSNKRDDIKKNPTLYKFKIIRIFDNAGDKILYEAFLHQYFNVKTNIKFFNRSNQTPFGFDTTGIKMSPETCEKLSISHKGWCTIKMTSEMKTKISIIRKAQNLVGPKSATYGIKHNYTEEQKIRLTLLRGGKNNIKAMEVFIFDNNGLFSFYCHGNFAQTCKQYNLSQGLLRNSFRNKGVPHIGNRSDMIGWSAILRSDYESIHGKIEV